MITDEGDPSLRSGFGILRILIVIGCSIAAALLCLAWLIPVWHYDWVPPMTATPDPDFVLFDLLCAGSSAGIVLVTAIANWRNFRGSKFQRGIYSALAAVMVFDLWRIAALLFTSRPWPDFR